MKINIETDAWADSQIASKLWLCEHLEDIPDLPARPTIWLLAGWYAVTSFLIFSRGNICPHRIVSFDIDPECAPVARKINNRWECSNQFYAETIDINSPNMSFAGWGGAPDIVINTSCEHLSGEWYHKVPDKTLVVLQGCDMPHEQHNQKIANPDDLLAIYPMREILFHGMLYFDYPDKKFKRSMIIGRK